MAFSLETIKKMCKSNEAIYQIAEQFVRENKVTLSSVQSFWKDEITIQGKVQEENLCYDNKIVLKEDQYFSYLCSCKNGSRNLFCCHLAAASLAYYKGLQKKLIPQQVITSPAIQKVLKAYTEQNIANMLKNEKQGELLLSPILHNTSKNLEGENKVYLSFRIKKGQKFYMIKSPLEFYGHMKQADTVEYGKELKFKHSVWAFQKENIPLVEFTLHLIEESAEYCKQFYPYRMNEIKKQRELELTKTNIDRFFSLFYQKSFCMETQNRGIISIQVERENPCLHLKIEEFFLENFQMTMEEAIHIIEGEEYLYILLGEKLYCCDSDYTKHMRVFLKEIGRYSTKLEYKISKRDMPLFCGQFLPTAKKYLKIEAEGIALEQYMPNPVKASFSFDIEENKIVTCEERFMYGEFSFNPLMGNNVPVTVCRDYLGEFRIKNITEKYFKYYDLETGKLKVYSEEEIFQLLETGIQEFFELGEVFISERFKQIKIASMPTISIGVSFHENLLNLKIDTKEFSEEEFILLLKSYKNQKKFYRLKSGEFIKIKDSSLSAFLEITDTISLSLKDLKKEVIEIPIYRAMYLENVLDNKKLKLQGLQFQADKRFRNFIQTLKNLEKNSYEVPNSLKNILRGYQKIGYFWLKTLNQWKLGGILADEMGLGKTLQMISFLLSEKENLKNPAIIICPASLIYNWENEVQRFAPSLKTLVVAGTATEREKLLKETKTAEIWITSYDLLKRDISIYKKENLRFSYEIIDEAQVIKNNTTQSAKAVKALSSTLRFALTGTPIENRLSELWSIFDYLMPGLLYSYKKFREELEIPIVRDKDEAAGKRLRNMINPFILRRLKKEVLKELPDKLETIVYSKMEEEQKKLYTAVVWRIKAELEGKLPEEISNDKIRILAELTRLRQICCAPKLCYKEYQGDSAKLSTCMELIQEGIEGGHKILLFSQFTSMLEIIKKELEKENISYYLLTGETPKKERVKIAEEFNRNREKIFLISLKAGGIGLNLTGADMIIHYDPWWNLAAQNQATDRAHRIGQKKRVMVFRLVVKNTIEENILKLQEKKKLLAEQIIGKENQSFTWTKKELLELLSEIK